MRTALATAVLASVAVGAAAEETWPAAWAVVADGRAARLEMLVGSSGAVSGTLAGESVDGFVAGDRLVLTLRSGDAVEVWSALRGDAVEAGGPFLAGTVDRAGEVTPWYAVPEETGGGAPAAAGAPTPPVGSSSAVNSPAAEVAVEAPVAEPPTAPPTARTSGALQPDDLSLEGRWRTPGGVVTIRQDGRVLEVVDGASGGVMSGRMTGATTFVVGLRTACCRGEMAGPGMIKWEDGVVWLRAEE